MLNILEIATLALLAAAVFGLCLLTASVPRPARPRFGHRGLERQRALEHGGPFRSAEPILMIIAGLVAMLPLTALRRYQERELRRADHWLGLTPDEYSAVCMLSGGALGVLGAVLSRYTGHAATLGLPAAAFGVVLPVMQVQEIIRARTKAVSRALPHAIEIAAMCMGAGMDFPSAIRLVADCGRDGRDALARELSVILEELELGRTRREALLAFADRVPSDAVRDFVNAVIQAEQKGNPLARVIQVQGRALGARRSVAAEEAAARAGVLMIGPLVLLVGCVLLLLMGPFVVNGVGF